MTGTVPVNKELLAGTVPVNKELLAGTVPVNKELLAGRVPVNNLFLIVLFGWYVFLKTSVLRVHCMLPEGCCIPLEELPERFGLEDKGADLEDIFRTSENN